MSSGGKSSFKRFVVVALLLAICSGGYFALQEFSARKVREFAKRYGNLARIEFDSALINPFERSLSVKGVKCSLSVGGNFTVDEIVIDKFDEAHRIPFFFKGSARGVAIPVDFMNFGILAGDLKKMGYRELNFDLSANYIYEEGAKRFAVNNVSVEGKDTFDFSASADFSMVDLLQPGFRGLIGVRLVRGGVLFTDNSLTGRYLELAAQSRKANLQAYRQELLDGLQLRMQKATSLGNGYAENFYAELIKFIANPAKLAFKAEPEEATPLLYLFMGRSFDELLELYGVTVESGKQEPVFN